MSPSVDSLPICVHTSGVSEFAIPLMYEADITARDAKLDNMISLILYSSRRRSFQSVENPVC